MSELLAALAPWTDPGHWLAWGQAHPRIALLILAPLAAGLLWGVITGRLGIRKAVINLAGIGLIAWGALWFADWVKPTLTAEDLFTPPVVGPQAVTAAFVEPKTIERTVTYTGTVHPFERIVLRARTEGFVKEVAAYPGDRVEAGQVVVRLETSELAPRLAKARAELRYLRAELKRDKELFEAGATPASTLDLSASRERVKAAEVRLLATRIGYATVRAPSDGWVSRRAVDPGQYVRKGDHLLAYDRLSQVRIRLDVAAQDLVHVGPGTPVVIELPGVPRQRLAGTALAERLVADRPQAALRAAVTAVFPRAEERSRLGVVEIVLPNPDLVLRAGLYVVAHLVTGRVEQAWAVPERALTPMPDGTTVVFVAPAFSDQGPVEMREVRVGMRTGREAQILEGLEEPGYVVIAGNRSLTDGETVDVIARTGGPV